MVTFLALIIRGLGEGREGKSGSMESCRNILPLLLKVNVFIKGSSRWVCLIVNQSCNRKGAVIGERYVLKVPNQLTKTYS